MFSPCFECYNRYGRQYTEECDTICDYAKVCLENKKLKKQALTYLEMLELEKVIIGRDVDYETAEQILSDFQKIMDRFNLRGENI